MDVLGIPSLYDAFYKSTELVAAVPTGRVDLDVDGRLLRGVPLSALPRLVRSFEGSSPRLVPATEKVRRAVDYVVDGSATVSVRVLGPREER